MERGSIWLTNDSRKHGVYMFGSFIESTTDRRESTRTRQSPPAGMKEKINFSKGDNNT
jgi:hypothetical protein